MFHSVGEGNRRHADLYACQQSALIWDWRRKFHAYTRGQTRSLFPFGVVQVKLTKITEAAFDFTEC